jgi:hypothetical protein
MQYDKRAYKMEFNLSDKRHLNTYEEEYYFEEDVKEFIRLLKEYAKSKGYYTMVNKIDMLSGDKIK